jgi:formylglycine-generating enzyme required for sulfatase activity
VARSSLRWWLAAAPALGACGGLVGLTSVPDTNAADSGPDVATEGANPTDADSGDGTDSVPAETGGPPTPSLEVTGGSFYRTYVNDGTGATGEADPATVSGFRLDEYDVTVARFRSFVAAVLLPDGGAGWRPSPGSGKHIHLNGGQGLVNGPSVDAGQTYEPGWASSDDQNIAPTDANLACTSAELGYPTWTPSPGDNENLPIDCVTWAEAYAFCIWDGGFLPSEAEWEYAAAGGNQQREYPWGSVGPGTKTMFAVYDCLYNGSGVGSCTGVANIAPVGFASLGAGPWGQLDLVGNMWQWNLDSYADSYASPCTDCAAVTPGAARVARGGCFSNYAPYLVPPFRGYRELARYPFIGFRCARVP